MLDSKGFWFVLEDSAHLNEDQLEGYAMHTLRESEVQAVEEHLLVCPSCQQRQAEADSYVRAMRGAARAEKARAKRLAFPKPVWVLALAAAAVLIVVVVIPRPQGGAPVSVLLQSTRGAGSVYAMAPSGKPLLLELDIAGLPAARFYRVEIVDSGGGVLRQTETTPSGGKLLAQPPLRLVPGRYYVRLYSRTSELLREYGLETRATAPSRP